MSNQFTNTKSNNPNFGSGDAGSAVQTCPNSDSPEGTETYWIEIKLLDEADQPVPNEEYCIIDPDGIKHRGILNAKGFARADGIKTPGTCRVTFPKLDKDAWNKI